MPAVFNYSVLMEALLKRIGATNLTNSYILQEDRKVIMCLLPDGWTKDRVHTHYKNMMKDNNNS